MNEHDEAFNYLMDLLKADNDRFMSGRAWFKLGPKTRAMMLDNYEPFVTALRVRHLACRVVPDTFLGCDVVKVVPEDFEDSQRIMWVRL